MEVRMAGAITNTDRQTRRAYIKELLGKVENMKVIRNEDQSIIDEIDERHIAPNVQWTTEDIDKPVEYENCSVQLKEYTHTQTAMFVHSIVRKFIISFTNKLRQDDIAINERLSLFQQAIVQVC
jgi:hypothetical protein